MKTIPILEVGIHINKKDLRSIRKWCKRNNVFINEDLGYVYESNLKEAIQKPFIDNLKLKFGKDWESVYKYYVDGNIPALNTLNDNAMVTKKFYKPKNDIAKMYLEKYKTNGKNKAA